LVPIFPAGSLPVTAASEAFVAKLPRLPIILILGAVFSPSIVAHAEPMAPDAEAARRAALHALPTACAADYDRLCQHPAESSRDGRAVLICLKDHMIDTTLTCRKVVRAAAH
jgi:hypothetical protein